MNVNAHSAPNASATPMVPVLRTVLLADMVDSTALVQRLGDVRGAALLQRVELHLRDLLAATQGQVIDKADGVLALFERPVHAVDFALRYQRLLAGLGVEAGVPDLTARVGIHVGEVMTWANDPRAVAAGAKPIEVEGLAKPVAARLMALALPGQVLLSGMAQTLAQRAANDLGERGERLRWIAHGRYRFKGVSTPMLVHEVGDPGLSPLRAPPSGQKAWREVPLWRRPPVLVVEALVLGGLVFASLYGTFKSEPALAFYQRDWVVVGDLNNLTAESRLTDPLETALRVGLQQSAYVNIVSDRRVEETLTRMGRAPGSAIDRDVGSEIAAREDARAVLLPTLTEVGGRLQISLELVDPNTKRTLFSDSAIAKGSRELLPAVDDVLARMRSRLGESIASIERSDMPLAEATTANIEALRAYSLGLQARKEYRLGDAFALQKQALQLDPDFAMAHVAIAALYFNSNDNPAAFAHIQAAQAQKGKLTLRENLYLDAVAHVYAPLEQMLAKWKLLGSMYPDEYRAYYNYAYFVWRRGFEYESAVAYLDHALTQHNPDRVNAQFLRGSMLLALDRPNESLAAFKLSESLGLRGYKGIYAAAYGSKRDFQSATRVMQSQEASGIAITDAEHQLTLAALEADQGNIDAATARLALVRQEGSLPKEIDQRFAGAGLLLRGLAPDADFQTDLDAHIQSLRKDFRAADASRQADLAYMLLSAAGLAARHGHTGVATTTIDQVEDVVRSAGNPQLSSRLGIAEAELALAKGQPQESIDRLAHAIESKRASYGTHAVLMRALAAVGDRKGAQAQAVWLAGHRGMAYAEYGHDFMAQAANVVESDLALLAMHRFAIDEGNMEAAERHLHAFRTAWPGNGGEAVARARTELLSR